MDYLYVINRFCNYRKISNICSVGELSERFKEHAWKVCIPQKGIEGSNPSLSAKKNEDFFLLLNKFLLLQFNNHFLSFKCKLTNHAKNFIFNRGVYRYIIIRCI